MRDYEVVCILDPGLEDSQVQEVIEKISSCITSASGVVENVRTSEVRRLAFPIKKRTEGIFTVINLKSETTLIQELDRVLKLDERILRHRTLVGTSLPALAYAPPATSAMDRQAPPTDEREYGLEDGDDAETDEAPSESAELTPA